MCEQERVNAIYETNIKTNFNCCTVKLVYLNLYTLKYQYIMEFTDIPEFLLKEYICNTYLRFF